MTKLRFSPYCRYPFHQDKCMQSMTRFQLKLLPKITRCASNSWQKLALYPHMMGTRDLIFCYWVWDLTVIVALCSHTTLSFMWRTGGSPPLLTHPNRHPKGSPSHCLSCKRLQTLHLLPTARGRLRWWPRFLGRSCHWVSCRPKVHGHWMGSSSGLLTNLLLQSCELWAVMLCSEIQTKPWCCACFMLLLLFLSFIFSFCHKL